MNIWRVRGAGPRVIFAGNCKMLTSYKNDPARLSKHVEESIYPGQYRMNVPGQGQDLPFQDEPRLRLAKWGANRVRDLSDLESDLLGLTRSAHKGDTDGYEKTRVSGGGEAGVYGRADPFVADTRASHPAFLYRQAETSQYRWAYPQINPQSTGVEYMFQRDRQTRILERDFPTSRPDTQYFFSARDLMPGDSPA